MDTFRRIMVLTGCCFVGVGATGIFLLITANKLQ